ncbi:MAG TPA: phospho-N-acetylmuramoyl-pentapeptide-transferase, partial [Smithellaceae bacterium]|nr:phospho-N-acetylmuramoyl-pentapeptide-transferase [Smithellaceae bacterium]
MVYEFLYPLHTMFSSFNVFRYITFRTIFASITALLICLVMGRWLICKLQDLQIDQQIREDGPQTHQVKKGTPTMGGILIIFAVVISTILWANLSVYYIWLALLVTVGFGLIGFIDDYSKLAGKSSRGLSGKKRLAAEIAIALFVGLILYFKPGFNTQITIPFIKTVLPNIGWGYVVLTVFIIVGAANAVNLTDGLDGLATGPAAICFATYLFFAYFAGNIKVAQYLQIPYVPGVGELSVFCGALLGAAIGFLWFNAYPAEIFMGDV